MNKYPSEIKNVYGFRQVISAFSEELTPEHREILENESIELAINGRLRRTLGRTWMYRDCFNKYHCKKIELSKKYLEVATIENIIDTIKHEVMHVITNVEHNENCNHDKRCKENCKLYGCCGMSTKKVDKREDI